MNTLLTRQALTEVQAGQTPPMVWPNSAAKACSACPACRGRWAEFAIVADSFHNQAVQAPARAPQRPIRGSHGRASSQISRAILPGRDKPPRQADRCPHRR